ncbi:MAG: SPOR domain-containing protein [Cocleimonas sp.]
MIPTKNSYAYQSKNSTMESSCYTLGPFGSSETARLVAKSINDFGLATEIRKQKTMQTLNFLVYLQAFSSRAEAEGVVKEISKHEIKNYKIIETGPYKNAISLGTFEDLDKARRHSEYVRFLGYDAKYTERKKKKEVFWIGYDEPFGSNAPVFSWAKKIDPRASVQKIPKACDF